MGRSKGERWDALMAMPTKDAESDSDEEAEDEEEPVAEVKKGKKRSAPTETAIYRSPGISITTV